MVDEGIAARIGADSNERLHAKILADHERRQNIDHVCSEEAVHIRQFQPGVSERVPDGEAEQVKMGISGRGAETREAHADERRSAANRGLAGHQTPPFDVNTMYGMASPPVIAARTGMPIFTAAGETPSMRLSMRAPSANSTIATL